MEAFLAPTAAASAGIGHKRFEHLMLVKAQFGGGFDPIAVIHMVV